MHNLVAPDICFVFVSVSTLVLHLNFSVEKDVAIVKICVNSVLLLASLIGLYAAAMSGFNIITIDTIITNGGSPYPGSEFAKKNQYRFINLSIDDQLTIILINQYTMLPL